MTPLTHRFTNHDMARSGLLSGIIVKRRTKLKCNESSDVGKCIFYYGEELGMKGSGKDEK